VTTVSEPATETTDHQRPRFSRRATWAVAGAWVVIATWLQLARMTGSARPWNSLWAEDGGVFLTNAYQRGLAGNLFRPHAGYYQVIDRLVAQPASHLPVSWAAAWMAWSGAAVVALCSLIVWNRSGAIVKHLAARGALTFLVPFLPQVAYEVTGVVNDLHWYLMFTLFWVLIAPPRSVRGCGAAGAFAVLVGLSDPLSALMLVAGAMGWWLAGRNVRALVAPVALVGSLIAQFIVHSAVATSAVKVLDIPRIYALRVVLSAFSGDRLLHTIYPPFGTKLTFVACIAMAVIVVVLARGASRRALAIAVSAFVLSGLYLAVSLGTRGTVGFLTPGSVSLNGSRYTVVPIWMVFTGLIVLADRWRPSGRHIHLGPTRLPLALLIVLLWLGVETLSEWSDPGTRAAAPAWDAEVAQARTSCSGPAEARNRVPPLVYEGPVTSGDVVLTVAPLPAPGARPLFAVVVSCDRLLH
jgi:hypothetical protein